MNTWVWLWLFMITAWVMFTNRRLDKLEMLQEKNDEKKLD